MFALVSGHRQGESPGHDRVCPNHASALGLGTPRPGAKRGWVQLHVSGSWPVLQEPPELGDSQETSPFASVSAFPPALLLLSPSPQGWRMLPCPGHCLAAPLGVPSCSQLSQAPQTQQDLPGKETGGHKGLGGLCTTQGYCPLPVLLTPLPAPILQVMLLGDSGVGKTCFLLQFKDRAFLSGTFIATVGIDFRVRPPQLPAPHLP